MSERKTFPFDLTGLAKGDWIPPEKCEEVAGYKRDHRDYPLRLLALSSGLADAWEAERGEVITTRIENGGIRICADDEAVHVNSGRFAAKVRGMKRDRDRTAGIDREKLSSDDLREEQERAVVRMGAFIAGGVKAARQALLQPHRRGTPLIGK